jgi:hypothetical protein
MTVQPASSSSAVNSPRNHQSTNSDTDSWKNPDVNSSLTAELSVKTSREKELSGSSRFGDSKDRKLEATDTNHHREEATPESVDPWFENYSLVKLTLTL